MLVVFDQKKAKEAQRKIRSSMNVIKVFGVVILCTLSCSGAVQESSSGNTKSDRSDAGVTQYMGYPGQGYGLGYGGPDYGGVYPAPPVPGLVPPYPNGGGYLGAPPYTGYYPPYGEFYPPPPPYPMVPSAPYPMVPPPMYPPVPYPGYPMMRGGLGYNQYSAKKRQDTNGLA